MPYLYPSINQPIIINVIIKLFGSDTVSVHVEACRRQDGVSYLKSNTLFTLFKKYIKKEGSCYTEFKPGLFNQAYLHIPGRLHSQSQELNFSKKNISSASVIK